MNKEANVYRKTSLTTIKSILQGKAPSDQAGVYLVYSVYQRVAYGPVWIDFHTTIRSISGFTGVEKKSKDLKVRAERNSTSVDII